MADDASLELGKRLHYAVGDIHGCFDELLLLEERVRQHAGAQSAEAFFVCVGDLVDRGPRSRDVVEHVMLGCRAGTHACVGGNHEAFMVETLLSEAPWNFETWRGIENAKAVYSPGLALRYRLEVTGGVLPTGYPYEDYRALSRMRWLRSGGRETLESFGCDPEDTSTWTIEPALLGFLVGLPLLWESKEGVVTHALATRSDLATGRILHARGLADPVGFHDSLTESETRTLDTLLWCREFPKETPDPARIHVTGHTPLERPYRDSVTGVVNVDTACVFGNMLSAFCFETGEFLSVPGWLGSPYR